MNEMKERVERKLESLGNSFVKMPRKVLLMSFSLQKKDRLYARIFMALVSMCYFKDGMVKLGKYFYTCHRGEYLGNYRELADRTDISFGSVGHYLKALSDDCLIEYEAIAGGTRIKVCNYDFFSGYLTENTVDYGNDISAAQAMAAAEQTMGGRSKQFTPKGKGGEA